MEPMGAKRSTAFAGLLAWAWVATGCSTQNAPALPKEPRADEYQSPFLAAELERITRDLSTRGFTRDGAENRGFLAAPSTVAREQALHAGGCYVAVIVGTKAIGELDARMFDINGAEVATSNLEGPHATFDYCPSQSGTYYVTVRAKQGAGLYEMRLFHGPSGVESRSEDLFATTDTEAAPQRTE